MARQDPGAALIRDVAVSASYRVSDAGPGRSRHVASDDDVPGPELLGQLPPLVVARRYDVEDVDDGLQRQGAVQGEAETVQDTAGVSQLRQELSTVASP